jgi:hypothetical protein
MHEAHPIAPIPTCNRSPALDKRLDLCYAQRIENFAKAPMKRRFFHFWSSFFDPA